MWCGVWAVDVKQVFKGMSAAGGSRGDHGQKWRRVFVQLGTGRKTGILLIQDGVKANALVNQNINELAGCRSSCKLCW